MNSKIYLRLSIAAFLFLTTSAGAQTRTDWIGPEGAEAAWTAGDLGGGEGDNWLTSSNDNFQPDRTFGGIGEYGSISNGGIAVIDEGIAFSPAAIRLAEDGGSTGTLVIRDGGSITVQEASGGQGDGLLSNGFAGSGSGTLVLRDNIGSVSVQRYSQTAGSTLVTQLSSNSSFANPVAVSEQITLAGSLRVNPTPSSGFAASTGDSWTIMSGAPVTGAFSSVSADPSLLSNEGQAFVVSTAGNAVTLSVQQRLILEVDRFTGATQLINPGGHSTDISLINYTLSSSGNLLDDSDQNWKSFADDAGKPGWFEANPTTQDLSELSPDSMATFSPGESHNLGSPLQADAAAPLGTNRVDVDGVTFNYQLPTGEYVPAAIVPVGRFNDLVLVIDPDTGDATLQNQSAQSFSLISYTISSDSDSLLSGYSGSGLTDWFVSNPTATDISELNTGAPLSLSPGAEVPLGVAWDSSAELGVEDPLTFQYQLEDGAYLQGSISFEGLADVPMGILGDYNGDSFVDAADYAVWRNTLGEMVTPGEGADGDNDGEIGLGDYNLWRMNYGMTSALVASTQPSSSQAAPEPLGVALLFLGVLLAPARMRMRLSEAT